MQACPRNQYLRPDVVQRLSIIRFCARHHRFHLLTSDFGARRGLRFMDDAQSPEPRANALPGPGFLRIQFSRFGLGMFSITDRDSVSMQFEEICVFVFAEPVRHPAEFVIQGERESGFCCPACRCRIPPSNISTLKVRVLTRTDVRISTRRSRVLK